MKCGFYKKTINPPLGTPIIGYYSERLTKGIIDDLYVKAIAFESDGVKAVIIQLDLCLLPEETCNEMRETVASFCGVDADAVFISCNHTHTGPLTSKDFASDKAADPNYMAFLNTSVRDTAAYAFEDLKPARFFTAETQAKGISFVRRFRTKDGPATFTKKLSALKVGDYVFAGFAGEPFTDIRNRVEGENRMLCALWNGSGGYFPHSQAYEEGGYEVFTSSFGPGTDDILVRDMTELLENLK